MRARGPADNLLIAETQARALHAGKCLGLDQESWYCVGKGAALCGRGFKKFVILNEGDHHTERDHEWLKLTIATKALPGATVHFL